MHDHPRTSSPIDRRAFLRGAGGLVGALALAPSAGAALGDARRPHFLPRARRVIFLNQLGAPSQLDLFDPKPKLRALDGQEMPASVLEGARLDQIRGRKLLVAGSRFDFAPRGECGTELSELLPCLAQVVDDIALVRTLHTDVINHDPAQQMWMTGHPQPGRPSLGAWVSHALGSANRDLPGFVVLSSGSGVSPPARLWGNGFLPGEHQGVRFLAGDEPVPFLGSPAGVDRGAQLAALRELSRHAFEETGDPAVLARLEASEMAYRMQRSVPELTDLSDEGEETRALYGVEGDEPSYARNCLYARRLVERGVRFVQLCHGSWDHHSQLPGRLPEKCAEVDRASAALLVDLERRGLLEDTLVVWGGEFGRTPMQQGGRGGVHHGRDHQGRAFSMWLAGGGVRRGTVVGATDELGFDIAEDPVHVHDLHATILHLLGLDHERLTFRHAGRDFRLTDVSGRVVSQLVA